MMRTEPVMSSAKTRRKTPFRTVSDQVCTVSGTVQQEIKPGRSLSLIASVVAACLVLIGCAAQSPAAGNTDATINDRDWINNPEKYYPPVKYITAVGVGDTIDAAETDALDKLARRFRVMLTSNETHRDRYSSSTGSDSALNDWQHNISLRTTVNLSTQEQLLNAEIVQRATDEPGRAYALGVIERLPTARLYAEQMRLQSELANSRYQAALKLPADRKLLRLAYLRSAAEAAESYFALSHAHDLLLGVTGRGGITAAEEPDLAAIRAAYNELRSEISVQMNWLGEESPLIQNTMSRIATEMGMAVVDKEQAADLRLDTDYVLRFRPVNRYGVIMADWLLTIKVKSGSDNRQVATITYNGQDGSSTEAGATLQAERRIMSLLDEKFADDLMKALYNNEAR